jgi:hypothetical protein
LWGAKDIEEKDPPKLPTLPSESSGRVCWSVLALLLQDFLSVYLGFSILVKSLSIIFFRPMQSIISRHLRKTLVDVTIVNQVRCWACVSSILDLEHDQDSNLIGQSHQIPAQRHRGCTRLAVDQDVSIWKLIKRTVKDLEYCLHRWGRTFV